MEFRYKTSGTCASEILVDIKEDDKTINNVQFLGGCNGNLKGISSLVKGRTIDEVIESLKGITCGFKPTSCPDQLATALQTIKEKL
jgi:uncharacterized protein (TIGR03905 family)